jgi:endonuclease YncB( thermonuclease family)
MQQEKMRVFLSIALSLAFCSVAAAQPAVENDTTIPPAQPRFRVVDCDTVKFGPQLERLFGIDAPEKAQPCDDGQWQPGPLARKALEGFIAGRPVTCRQVDFDTRYNRPVAQCFAGEDDLQEKMVSAGWA